MRSYYPCEQIRAAEAPLLAALPEGTLMRRASYGSHGWWPRNSTHAPAPLPAGR